jgi:hypothetical protein
MRFYASKDDVIEKRRNIFQVLKIEGLKKNQNPYVKEEDVDRMWDE